MSHGFLTDYGIGSAYTAQRQTGLYRRRRVARSVFVYVRLDFEAGCRRGEYVIQDLCPGVRAGRVTFAFAYAIANTPLSASSHEIDSSRVLVGSDEAAESLLQRRAGVVMGGPGGRSGRPVGPFEMCRSRACRQATLGVIMSV